MRPCRRCGSLVSLTAAMLVVIGPVTATAVVQARSPRDAQPRVTARTQGQATRSLGKVGLLPLGDAPRAPGTGRVVGDALCAALASRDAQCVSLAPPVDATGKPLSGDMVNDTKLAAAGRAAGAALAITGKVTLLDVEADWLPNLVVWRPGVLVDVPAGGVFRTSLTFQLRAVTTETGKLLCAAQVRHGPVEILPERALAEAAAAALDQCFGAR